MGDLKLQINKNEVLRYLGYKGQDIDENIVNLIEECREEIKKIITPRFMYEYKDIIQLDEAIEVVNTKLILYGKDIKEHLKDSKKCVLMAVDRKSVV